MTATDFDPEAIAARVLEREQADPPAPVVPAQTLAREDGPCVTGTGQTRGRPLPTVAEGDGSDIFDRLERQREAKRIHSPIVLRDLPFEPTARTRAERAAADERYVAPPLVEDELVDDVVDDPEPDSASPQVTASGSVPKRQAATDNPADIEVPVKAVHDARCGEILSGGGAPRGWVLIRVIGSGAPRRYCTSVCAITALTPPPLPGRKRASSVGRVSADQQWRDLLAALGKTPADVRAWCAGQRGLGIPARGPVPQHARDAFLAAHRVDR